MFHYNLFLHATIEHFGGIQILAIISTAAISTLLNVFWHMYGHISVGYIARSDIDIKGTYIQFCGILNVL